MLSPTLFNIYTSDTPTPQAPVKLTTYADVSDLDKHTTHISVQDKINELNNLIIDEDRDDGSILTDIDPDLNMLYNMNDTINNSSRYFDNSTFRITLNKYKNTFSILNANIRV